MEGHSIENVPFEMSQMSPIERARLAALVELDGDPALREHLLGAVGRAPERRRRDREIPDRWTVIHTLDRLEEAVEVRAMMPASTRPKAFGSAWPVYTYSQ